MKARIQGLEAQLARERNSVNKESYYYNVEVSTKHRTSFLCFNAEPYYKYHTERRFNQAKYDQDVAAANNRIRNLEAEISSLKQQEIAEQARQQRIAEEARQRAIAEEQARQQRIAEEQARQRAIAEEQARQKRTAEEAKRQAEEEERQKKIAAEKARLEAIEKAKIEAEITVVRKDLNQVQEKLNREKSVSSAVVAKRQEVENKCTQIKVANDAIKTKLNEQPQAIFEMLQSADDKQRAFLLSELLNQPDSETMINIIKSLGVDANSLAYYAIKKSNNELFDLALNYGANCCDYQIEGKTLLQQLIHSGNESFIKKILATGQDLTSTVMEAIGQNDVVTFDKLLSYNNSYLSQKFSGYTLLQTAISAQKIEIVQKILQLDSTSVKVLTNNGESALKIAVRSRNPEILQMVAEHVNLEMELAQLDSKVEQALKDKILEYQDIETVIKLLRGEEISLEQYLLSKQNHENEHEQVNSNRAIEEGVVAVEEEARLNTIEQIIQQNQDCDEEQLASSSNLQGVINIESLKSQFDGVHLIGDNVD